ncbi:MAG: type II toxin-antitoxin system mRNA interferase toxin, RelE/StbE family [Candidatus Magasanikbacteria bacterium]|nr:type II toxin-antitoxin system mRNA interferase toxin, RelE/StbE family [Candidatus Magasanikbacteria bacterium]
MRFKIVFSKRFVKHYQKAPKKVQQKFNERIIIFENNQYDERLRSHFLAGEWAGCKSIDITGDWRAVYEKLENGLIEWVEFVEIGTHSQLYG